MDTDTSDNRSKATDLPDPIGFTDPDSLTKVCIPHPSPPVPAPVKQS